MEIQHVEKILGRKQHEELLHTTSDKRILITGGAGSIGQALAKRCPKAIVTDIEELDVVNWQSILKHGGDYDIVINLAGEKHAPQGETETLKTLEINTMGSYNLLRAFPKSKHILASTCKACNPETAYGATKLLAERLYLNSGGTVARFFNVIQTSGNVFEIWDKTDNREVYECQRYFISIDEAVGLLIACIDLDGRWSVNPGEAQSMTDVYTRIYGDKPNVQPRRRGDRLNEKLCSTSETIEIFDSLIKVTSYHD